MPLYEQRNKINYSFFTTFSYDTNESSFKSYFNCGNSTIGIDNRKDDLRIFRIMDGGEDSWV